MYEGIMIRSSEFVKLQVQDLKKAINKGCLDGLK